jgi:hypothetical protein
MNSPVASFVNIEARLAPLSHPCFTAASIPLIDMTYFIGQIIVAAKSE